MRCMRAVECACLIYAGRVCLVNCKDIEKPVVSLPESMAVWYVCLESTLSFETEESRCGFMHKATVAQPASLPRFCLVWRIGFLRCRFSVCRLIAWCDMVSAADGFCDELWLPRCLSSLLVSSSR